MRPQSIFVAHDGKGPKHVAFVKAKEFVAKDVEITGTTANRDGMKGIIVNSVKPL